MMRGAQRRQNSDVSQLLPAGDEQSTQVLRGIHVPQHHAYEPGVIELFVLVDDDSVHAKHCCCPGDEADLERANTQVPRLHG